jgi:hypothetical protein
VSYGNSFSIENDNTKQCINLNITREKKSDGSFAYKVLCQNYETKFLTKLTLATGIRTALTSAGIPWLSDVATAIADIAYNKACKYFSE